MLQRHRLVAYILTKTLYHTDPECEHTVRMSVELLNKLKQGNMVCNLHIDIEIDKLNKGTPQCLLEIGNQIEKTSGDVVKDNLEEHVVAI